jgi:hypothetical protein
MTERIDPDRVLLALTRIQSTDGFIFERFANEFLAAEFPTLRPVAGIHDQGRDAFIYQPDDDPETFVQSSVTQKWADKIRKTVTRLKESGHNVQQLIYCTNQDIVKDCGDLKKELRRDHKITLDVRDQSYFVAFANVKPGFVAAAEGLAQRYVDPLVSKLANPPIGPAGAGSDEERIVTAYLRLALTDKDPEKALTKFSYETLVIYALRNATAEEPMPRDAVHAALSAVLSADTSQRRVTLTNGALERLTNRNIVKHHTKTDRFTLSHSERTALQRKIETNAEADARILVDVGDRIRRLVADLGIDYAFDRAALAMDVQLVCDRVLASQARSVSKALVHDVPYAPEANSISEHALALINEEPSRLKSAAELQATQIYELVVPIVDDLLRRPTQTIRKRLRATVDGYCLFFVLRETPDVQAALSRVMGDASIIVDTNIIIPCMAESLLPEADAQMTQLLRAAVATGMRLIVVDDVLEELDTHIMRLRYGSARNQYEGMSTAKYGLQDEPLLVTAFKLAASRQSLGSFDDFLNRFAGRNFPRNDLKEYVQHSLGLEYDALTTAYDAVHRRSEIVGDAFAAIKEMKRRRPWMDETAFERLVMHDTRSLLVVEELRAGEAGAYAGARWWWLTLDRTAHRVDEARKGAGRGLCCMSPDFFARFLSIRPTSREAATALTTLPLSVAVAALDLVPKDLTEQALAALNASQHEPEYLRRRKLRDLLHDARSTRGEMLRGGVEDLAAAIEESLVAPTSGLMPAASAAK